MGRGMLHRGGRVALGLCVLQAACTPVKNRSLPHKGAAGAAAGAGAKEPSPGDLCEGADMPGDCKKAVCDADGGVVFMNDDKDIPKPAPCQKFTCKDGDVQPTDLAE